MLPSENSQTTTVLVRGASATLMLVHVTVLQRWWSETFAVFDRAMTSKEFIIHSSI